jgi:predicted Ser/Thr protein kinase
MTVDEITIPEEKKLDVEIDVIKPETPKYTLGKVLGKGTCGTVYKTSIEGVD